MGKRRSRKRVVLASSAEERALDALSMVRRGMSLRQAAAAARTDPRTVLRHVGPGFRKQGRRWAPTPFDRIPRRMTALTRAGPIDLVVRDSRTATALSAHRRAVGIYVETDDEEPLRHLRRTRIRVAGEDIELVTDPVQIDRLAAGGEVHYELYRT